MNGQMKYSRRYALRAALLASMGAITTPLIGSLAGCHDVEQAPSGTTKVYVLGTIHSRHRDSEAYSLAVLEQAVRKAAPDIVLTEIPPDRIVQGLRSFAETGVVDEPRIQVFPEYTDVIFPLSQELDFEILGTAGWTQKIADDRRAALAQIQTDPTRANEWLEHRQAQRDFRARLRGRGDHPRFIHTREFDQFVEISRTPYQNYFDKDLGMGGWTQINRAHTDLIEGALDSIAGEGRTALITFGSAHKYMIHRALSTRSDVNVLDSGTLFL